MKTVYVLHAYGANSHYNGLLALCQQEGIKLVFREFRVYYLTKQALKNKNYTCFTSMNEDFGGTYIDEHVVVDLPFITAKSAASAIGLGYSIVGNLL